ACALRSLSASPCNRPILRTRSACCARRKRPRGSATEKRGQEFSSFNVACHVTLRLGVIHAMEGSYHVSIARSVANADRQVGIGSVRRRRDISSTPIATVAPGAAPLLGWPITWPASLVDGHPARSYASSIGRTDRADDRLDDAGMGPTAAQVVGERVLPLASPCRPVPSSRAIWECTFKWRCGVAPRGYFSRASSKTTNVSGGQWMCYS